MKNSTKDRRVVLRVLSVLCVLMAIIVVAYVLWTSVLRQMYMSLRDDPSEVLLTLAIVVSLILWWHWINALCDTNESEE